MFRTMDIDEQTGNIAVAGSTFDQTIFGVLLDQVAFIEIIDTKGNSMWNKAYYDDDNYYQKIISVKFHAVQDVIVFLFDKPDIARLALIKLRKSDGIMLSVYVETSQSVNNIFSARPASLLLESTSVAIYLAFELGSRFIFMKGDLFTDSINFLYRSINSGEKCGDSHSLLFDSVSSGILVSGQVYDNTENLCIAGAVHKFDTNGQFLWRLNGERTGNTNPLHLFEMNIYQTRLWGCGVDRDESQTEYLRKAYFMTTILGTGDAAPTGPTLSGRTFEVFQKCISIKGVSGDLAYALIAAINEYPFTYIAKISISSENKLIANAYNFQEIFNEPVNQQIYHGMFTSSYFYFVTGIKNVQDYTGYDSRSYTQQQGFMMRLKYQQEGLYQEPCFRFDVQYDTSNDLIENIIALSYTSSTSICCMEQQLDYLAFESGAFSSTNAFYGKIVRDICDPNVKLFAPEFIEDVTYDSSMVGTNKYVVPRFSYTSDIDCTTTIDYQVIIDQQDTGIVYDEVNSELQWPSDIGIGNYHINIIGTVNEMSPIYNSSNLITLKVSDSCQGAVLVFSNSIENIEHLYGAKFYFLTTVTVSPTYCKVNCNVTDNFYNTPNFLQTVLLSDNKILLSVANSDYSQMTEYSLLLNCVAQSDDNTFIGEGFSLKVINYCEGVIINPVPEFPSLIIYDLSSGMQTYILEWTQSEPTIGACPFTIEYEIAAQDPLTPLIPDSMIFEGSILKILITERNNIGSFNLKIVSYVKNQMFNFAQTEQDFLLQVTDNCYGATINASMINNFEYVIGGEDLIVQFGQWTTSILGCNVQNYKLFNRRTDLLNFTPHSNSQSLSLDPTLLQLIFSVNQNEVNANDQYEYLLQGCIREIPEMCDNSSFLVTYVDCLGANITTNPTSILDFYYNLWDVKQSVLLPTISNDQDYNVCGQLTMKVMIQDQSNQQPILLEQNSIYSSIFTQIGTSLFIYSEKEDGVHNSPFYVTIIVYRDKYPQTNAVAAGEVLIGYNCQGMEQISPQIIPDYIGYEIGLGRVILANINFQQRMPNLCPQPEYIVTDLTHNLNYAQFDQTKFYIDYSNAFIMNINDYGYDLEPITFKISAFIQGIPTITASTTFKVTFANFCDNQAVIYPSFVNDVNYTIGESAVAITILYWSVSIPGYCDPLDYSMKMKKIGRDIVRTSLDESIFSFDSNDMTLTVYTDDYSKVGTYDMKVVGVIPQSTDFLNKKGMTFNVTLHDPRSNTSECKVIMLQPNQLDCTDSEQPNTMALIHYIQGQGVLKVQFHQFTQIPGCNRHISYTLYQRGTNTHPKFIEFNTQSLSMTINSVKRSDLLKATFYPLLLQAQIQNTNGSTLTVDLNVPLFISTTNHGPPYFSQDLPDVFLTSNVSFEYTEALVTFPQLLDPDVDDIPSIHSVDLGFQASMFLHIKDHKIYVQKGVARPVGIYPIQLKVIDNNPTLKMEQTYSFNVIVNSPLQQNQTVQNSTSKNIKAFIPLEARIQKITTTGHLIIEFNKDFELAEKNNLNNLLQLKSNQEGFSWNVTSTSNRQIVIQLNFDNPLNVSSSQLEIDKDFIEIRFRNNAIYDPETLQPFAGDMLKRIMPKQLPNDDSATKVLQNAQSSVKTVLSTVIYGNFLVNIFMASSLQTLWGMISVMQLIVNMPLLNLQFPANTLLFYNLLIDISNFDVMSINSVKVAVFSRLTPSESPERYAQLGYEQTHLFENSMNFFFFTILTLNAIIMTWFLKFLVMRISLLKNVQVLIKLISYLEKSLIWGSMIRLYIESYMQIAVSSNLNVTSDLQVTFVDKFQKIIAWVIMLTTIIVPIGVTYRSFTYKKLNVQRNGVWFEEVKTDKLSALMYNVLFMARRLVYIILAQFLEEYPGIQVQALLLLSIMLLIYNINAMPFKDKQLNILELFNEICLIIANYHTILFTDYSNDPQLSYNVGWSIILLTIFNIVVNMAYLLYKTFKELRLRYVLVKQFALKMKQKLQSAFNQKRTNIYLYQHEHNIEEHTKYEQTSIKETSVQYNESHFIDVKTVQKVAKSGVDKKRKKRMNQQQIEYGEKDISFNNNSNMSQQNINESVLNEVGESVVNDMVETTKHENRNELREWYRKEMIKAKRFKQIQIPDVEVQLREEQKESQYEQKRRNITMMLREMRK